jgi:endo-1,4-beta-xylanase
MPAQAEAYRQAAGACVAIEACRSIPFWGVSGRRLWSLSARSFKGFGSALLLDEAYGFKPAYGRMRQAIESADKGESS